MADDSHAQTPALTTAFYLFGALCGFVALYLGTLAATLPREGLYSTPAVVAASWLPCAGAFFLALLCFGSGYALNLLARIARDSREALLAAGGRAEALQFQLEAIKARLAALAPDVGFYYQDASGESAGPVTLDELRTLAGVGAIDADTLVCQEGREDWLPLGARVTL